MNKKLADVVRKDMLKKKAEEGNLTIEDIKKALADKDSSIIHSFIYDDKYKQLRESNKDIFNQAMLFLFQSSKGYKKDFLYKREMNIPNNEDFYESFLEEMSISDPGHTAVAIEYKDITKENTRIFDKIIDNLIKYYKNAYPEYSFYKFIKNDIITKEDYKNFEKIIHAIPLQNENVMVDLITHNKVNRKDGELYKYVLDIASKTPYGAEELLWGGYITDKEGKIYQDCLESLTKESDLAYKLLTSNQKLKNISSEIRDKAIWAIVNGDDEDLIYEVIKNNEFGVNDNEKLLMTAINSILKSKSSLIYWMLDYINKDILSREFINEMLEKVKEYYFESKRYYNKEDKEKDWQEFLKKKGF